MKKILLTINLIFISVLFSNPVFARSGNKFIIINDIMTTDIQIGIYEDYNFDVEEDLKKLFEMYHTLSDNFTDEKGEYLENIYTINEKPNQKLEIDLELYEMLRKAKQYEELSNGYFNASIGKLIDLWKQATDTYGGREIDSEDFNNIMNQVEEIEVVRDGFELTNEDNKYFVKIKEGVKLDLGAIAKGYAVQKGYDYLISKGLKYFYINGGQSSIAIGKHINNEINNIDKELMKVTITSPILGNEKLGYMFVKETSVTTSAMTYQYFTYQGKYYHHIVSPITKKPEHNYLGVTIVGGDLGFSDAMSTAFMSMKEEDIIDVINKTDEDLLEVYYIDNKEKINQLINDKLTINLYENNKLDKNLYIIIGLSSIILLLGGALVFGFLYKKQEKKNEKEN